MLGHQRRLAAIAAIAATGLALAGELRAQAPGHLPQADLPTAPAIGGLSLVPERWRYRPSLDAVAVTSSRASLLPPNPPRHGKPTLRSLDEDYVADRASFINTVRARRGLALLTFWEGAGRCLFFGINERGRPGINFVRMRTLRDTEAVENPLYTRYAELTGQVRPTFPEPPRLFPH